MKKKVKKIPKYDGGTPSVTPFYENANFYSAAGNFLEQQINNVQLSKQGVTGLGITKGALGGAAAGANVGTMIAPGIGTAIGAVGGALVGGITSAWGHGASADVNSNSTDFNEIFTPETGISGLFHNDEDDRQQAYRVQNSNYSKLRTEQIKHKYATKGIAPNPNVLAAEGGIMRQPVDALVSKGELIYNPMTKKLSKVPGSKGKPNKEDNVYARLAEGDVVISNSPTMLMANGKTPALNLEGLVDSDKNVKAKEAIIKKVVNWQEANKTKSQKHSKYDKGGTVVKIGKDPIDKLEEELLKTQIPEITGKDRRWVYHLKNASDKLSDFIPLGSALLGNYDYETVKPRIGRNFNIPVDYNINNVLADNLKSYAINNYNVSLMGGSTGAYLAAANQSAANLMKANSDARIYQKNKQNELIAKNVAQLNDWERYANNQLWAADVATDQNQAAADYIRRTDIKSGLNWLQGRRRDRQILPALKQYLQYGMYDDVLKGILV